MTCSLISRFKFSSYRASDDESPRVQELGDEDDDEEDDGEEDAVDEAFIAVSCSIRNEFHVF